MNSSSKPLRRQRSISCPPQFGQAPETFANTKTNTINNLSVKTTWSSIGGIMESEIKIPPSTDDWDEKTLQEARAAIFREIEAETRQDRPRQKQARHESRPPKRRGV